MNNDQLVNFFKYIIYICYAIRIQLFYYEMYYYNNYLIKLTENSYFICYN